MIRVAAAGDLHASDGTRDELAEAFARVEHEADLVLLAGDLTAHGAVEEAQVLGDACRSLAIPVYAVLGNHDVHLGHGEQIVEQLSEAGLHLLQREHAVCSLKGLEVGIVGTKGFVGGFQGSTLSDFGEPSLRRVYAETGEEVAAIEGGLLAVAHCPLRIVLLHYAPVVETLRGEPLGIQTFLGSSRLATPIAAHPPHLVLHGHAHAGSFEGRIGQVPVHNVAVHVTGRDFSVFELEVEVEAPT